MGISVCVLQAHVNRFIHSAVLTEKIILWPCLQPPLPFLVVFLPILFEFCTLCIYFAHPWSLPLSYLVLPCVLLIAGSRLSQHFITDCLAASVLSVGYCYACILEFLGLLSCLCPCSCTFYLMAPCLVCALLASTMPPCMRTQVLNLACQ